MNRLQRIEYYKSMSIIAIPIVLQQLISVGLNLIDNLMIGMVSEEALAAVGAANQLYFVFTTMCYGLYSGAAVYTAQYWGAGDIKNIRKILGMDYLIGISIAIVFALMGTLAGSNVISIFDDSREIVVLGRDYLSVVSFSFFFTAISFAISYNSRAIQDLKIPTIINACALTVNTTLNFCLIYGNLGFPKMGVKGAAIATLVARVLECSGLLFYLYTSRNHPLKTKISELLSFTKGEVRKVMKTALPVVVTEGGWAISMSLIFSIYGHLGTSALAVTQVANTVSEFLQSAYFGIGNASAVLIGNELGRNNRDYACKKAKLSLKIVGIFNIFTAFLLITFREPFSLIYHFNAGTTKLLSVVLLAWAFAIIPKMFAYLLVCGILRAGGDTTYCMYMDFLYNLIAQVSLAYLGVYVLNLPLYHAMLLVAVGDILKVIHCYHRFKSGKWIKLIIRKDDDK